MGFFVVIVRVPFGLAASVVLLLWTAVVALVYLTGFIFLAIFGKLKQINNSLNPWLAAFNGVRFLPSVWGWVFRPYQGIFEENPNRCSIELGGGSDNEAGSRLRQLRAAAEERERSGQYHDSDYRG